MKTIQGTCNTAIAYCRTLDPRAEEQIRTLCSQPAFTGNTIRIMPDAHAGAGCTIGTTMTISDKIVPNLVGVDIGCGMETVALTEKEIDLPRLDQVIRRYIPSAQDIRDTAHPFLKQIDLTKLRCREAANLHRAEKSLGTLGGGNHFIEIDRAANGTLYLVIHSGSRYLGKQTAEYYQNQGYRSLWEGAKYQAESFIARMKAEGRAHEIQAILKERKKEQPVSVPKDLAYVEGPLFEDYLHDMKLVQRFALLNRKAMAQEILSHMGLTAAGSFTTIHNYIDTESMILRKGAVSAKKDERLLIPINMKDGSFLCRGLGNPDWNESAPHGAGRLMSRKAAFHALSLADFKEKMQGIYSTSISRATLDEAPMAYKSMDEIISQIGPTAEVIEHLTPIYNFKASH